MAKRKEKDKFGLISLILGIASVLFMFIGFAVSFVGFFGFILMILTFIFSGVQLKKNKNNLAVAGLILAFVALGFFLLDSVLTASVQNGSSTSSISEQIGLGGIGDSVISGDVRMTLQKVEINDVLDWVDVYIRFENLASGSHFVSPRTDFELLAGTAFREAESDSFSVFRGTPREERIHFRNIPEVESYHLMIDLGIRQREPVTFIFDRNESIIK